jgi:hypothetical protein
VAKERHAGHRPGVLAVAITGTPLTITQRTPVAYDFGSSNELV